MIAVEQASKDAAAAKSNTSRTLRLSDFQCMGVGPGHANLRGSHIITGLLIVISAEQDLVPIHVLQADAPTAVLRKAPPAPSVPEPSRRRADGA